MKHQRVCCAPSAAPSGDNQSPRTLVGTAMIAPPSNLIALEAGEFLMGSDNSTGYPADGEGPARLVTLSAFSIAAHAVTNARFEAFVRDSGYVTDAERAGWSFVFQGFVAEGLRDRIMGISSEAPWWVALDSACWSRPEGPGSSIADRPDHPVTHVSWHDARAYCRWSGTRLPSEAEWEYAARGGLEATTYPWGDELEADEQYHCNIWQGEFPTHDLGRDGYIGTAPVDAYEPNGYGLYNCVGNVWEWCEDWFSPNYHRVTGNTDPHYVIPTGRRTIRGGSFLCHRSYCNRYRVAARTSNTPESTTNHCGFRVAKGGARIDVTPELTQINGPMYGAFRLRD